MPACNNCITCFASVASTAWCGLKHAHAIALCIHERNVLPDTGYLHGFTEHGASGSTHPFDCVSDAIHRDDNGRMLCWPVWLLREEATVDGSSLFGTVFVGLGRGCKNVVAHCLAERLGLPAKRLLIKPGHTRLIVVRHFEVDHWVHRVSPVWWKNGVS